MTRRIVSNIPEIILLPQPCCPGQMWYSPPTADRIDTQEGEHANVVRKALIMTRFSELEASYVWYE